jgi:transposase
MRDSKYSKEERLAIGKEIYDGDLSVTKAAVKYELNYYTAREYYRFYRDSNNLPNKLKRGRVRGTVYERKRLSYDELKQLSQDKLIEEVIKARVEAERAKKGYIVKGGGQTKEFITSNNENTK